jgi:hypothetical protein
MGYSPATLLCNWVTIVDSIRSRDDDANRANRKGKLKGSAMATTVFDCARVPGDTCSVQMVGERDDVLRAAQDHLVSTHGMQADGDLQKNVTRVVDEHHQSKTYGLWGA